MKKLLLILLVLANTMVFAQQSLIEKGNEAYGNYMFEIAADYYEKALPAIKTDEEKALISLKLGIAISRLVNSHRLKPHLVKLLHSPCTIRLTILN